MTELESLRAERINKLSWLEQLTTDASQQKNAIADIDARIAELEREPQRWQPETATGRYYYVGASGVVRDAVGSGYDFNAFPTEARALEVATHFRRLGLAAQWGALLTDEAMKNLAGREYFWRTGHTWGFVFPTAAHRDGFMADAEREGLL